MIQVDDNEVKEPKVKIKEFDVDELEEVETATNHKEKVEKGGTEQKAEMPLCLQHELRNLDTFYNPTLPQSGNFTLMFSVESGLGDPVNYDKAWNHDNPAKKKMWRVRIQKKLESMEDKGVWKVIKKEA